MSGNVRKLTHCAMMVALSTVLSMFAVYKMSNGGSITFASMAPIILISMMYSFRWAMLTSISYAAIQMLLGFYAPPTQDFLSFTLVILLDYLIAFGVLGCAGVIARRFKNRVVGAIIGSVAVVLGRLCCSFLSGIIVWGVYAPEGMPVWLYSLTYNSSYMIPEMIITAIAVGVLMKFLPLEKMTASQT